jgi:hypothetical protein
MVVDPTFFFFIFLGISLFRQFLKFFFLVEETSGSLAPDKRETSWVRFSQKKL